MSKRPEVGPGKPDREIFVKQLPDNIYTEELLRNWVEEDFGEVEHVLMLSEDLFSITAGRAYIRFKEHEAAMLYIDAEGETAAGWSEAERAAQRGHCVYGSDIHAAFSGSDGDVLKAVLDYCGIKKLWMQSEVQEPWGEGAPPLEAVQPIIPYLHFCVECEFEKLEDVRLTLGEVLQDFHERATNWLRAPPPVSRKQRMMQRFYAADPTDEKNPMSRQIRAKKKREVVVPKGKCLVWDSAHGKYVKEDLPIEVVDLIASENAESQSQLGSAPSRGTLTKVKTELAPDTPLGRPPNPKWYVKRELGEHGDTTANSSPRRQVKRELGEFKRELLEEHNDSDAHSGLALPVPAYEEEPAGHRPASSEDAFLKACRQHLSSKPHVAGPGMQHQRIRSRSPRRLLGKVAEQVASTRWKPRLQDAEQRAAQAQQELENAQSEIEALRQQLELKKSQIQQQQQHQQSASHPNASSGYGGSRHHSRPPWTSTLQPGTTMLQTGTVPRPGKPGIVPRPPGIVPRPASSPSAGGDYGGDSGTSVIAARAAAHFPQSSQTRPHIPWPIRPMQHIQPNSWAPKHVPPPSWGSHWHRG